MVDFYTQCWPLLGHGARAVCEAQGARRGARGGCGDAAGRAPAPLAAPAGGEVQPGQSAEDIELLKRAAMPTVSSWAESCRAVPRRRRGPLAPPGARRRFVLARPGARASSAAAGERLRAPQPGGGRALLAARRERAPPLLSRPLPRSRQPRRQRAG